MTSQTPERRASLRARLDVLHEEYAEAINLAIAANRDDLVAELAAAYDLDATRMVAEHEGKTHLLPLRKPDNPGRTRRRWLTRLDRRQSPA
jgi:hypothetical protein